jgi:hypothetical protein
LNNNRNALKPELTQQQLITLYSDQLREKQRERRRAYYARNRARITQQRRVRRAAARQQALEREAAWREKNRFAVNDSIVQWRHGPGFAAWRRAAWIKQGGKCYLCQRELSPDLMPVVEHDHRCHPSGTSCDVCRRGLACNPCNRLIAIARDDPDRLETIARNLRSALDAVTKRMRDTRRNP